MSNTSTTTTLTLIFCHVSYSTSSAPTDKTTRTRTTVLKGMKEATLTYDFLVGSLPRMIPRLSLHV